VLPFDTAQSEPQAAPATPAQLSTRNRGPVGPCKILVAEDSPVLQRIVIHQLQSLDYAVVLAANGLEAIEAMKHHSFDLVLMDWQMPQMDGIQATHMIRSMDNGANVPIIAMTANAMEGDRLSCLNAGMNDYISKPFTVEQLQKTVQGWLPEDSVTSTQQS